MSTWRKTYVQLKKKSLHQIQKLIVSRISETTNIVGLLSETSLCLYYLIHRYEYICAAFQMRRNTFEPGHEKMCLMPYANNKGADQPAHPRSLICAFVVRYLDSIIPLVSISKISKL